MKQKAISVVLALVLVVVGFVALPASAALAGTKMWDGGAGTSNWADANNWNDDVVPVAVDNILLDNSLVAGSYTVNLPSGGVTTAINRLQITPGAGNTITLVLPSSNTAAPGFSVGDAAAATDDMILDNGATLINSSGASSGNGIQANSTSNGTVRINNGAKYVHNTSRSAAGVVPLLSTVVGTELGAFEYDVPSTSSFPITASGRTYGSLTLTRTMGAATYTATGGSALAIRGHLTLNAGVTFNSSMTAALNLGGNLINNGAALTFPSGQAVNFNGASAQTASGSGAISFSSLTLNNVAGASISRDVTVNTTLALASGDITTGPNILTLAEAATTSGGGDVWGNTRRIGTLTTGKTYTFGNPNISLNFASAATMPTDVTINLVAGPPVGFAGAVNRSYTITPTGGSDFSATVRLRYLAGELGANTESRLHLWRSDGAAWQNQGQSAIDTANKWVEATGVTAFSPWALASSTPTAITLRTLSATSPSPAPASFTGLVLLGGLTALVRRRRT